MWDGWTCATENSGAPDVIRDGVEGRLFAYGDENELLKVLDWALSRPTDLCRMGKAAFETAQKATWAQFEEAFS